MTTTPTRGDRTDGTVGNYVDGTWQPSDGTDGRVWPPYRLRTRCGNRRDESVPTGRPSIICQTVAARPLRLNGPQRNIRPGQGGRVWPYAAACRAAIRRFKSGPWLGEVERSETSDMPSGGAKRPARSFSASEASGESHRRFEPRKTSAASLPPVQIRPLAPARYPKAQDDLVLGSTTSLQSHL